jgi:hypothetical protein
VLHLRPPFYAYEKANIKKVLDNNKPGVRGDFFNVKSDLSSKKSPYIPLFQRGNIMTTT